MVKQALNNITWKWLAGVLITVMLGGLGYYVKAQDTIRVDTNKRIDKMEDMVRDNRDTILSNSGEIKRLRTEMKGEFQVIKALMQVSLKAQGVPDRIIVDAINDTTNGDSLR